MMDTRRINRNGGGGGFGRPMLVDLSTRIPLQVPIDEHGETAPERSQNHGHHTEETQNGPGSQHPGMGNLHASQNSRRVAWSHDELKEVIWCHEYGKFFGNTSTAEVYELWRSRNQNTRLDIDAKKLAAKRRYILNNNKLNAVEIEEITANIIRVIEEESDIGNVRNSDTNVDELQPPSEQNYAIETQSSPGQRSQDMGNLYAPQSSRRTRWSHEENKEVIWCFEYGKFRGNSSVAGDYELWRERNPNIRPNLDANKLANQRRFIMKKNKLSEAEITEIRASVMVAVEEESSIRGERSAENEEQQVIDRIGELPLLSGQGYASDIRDERSAEGEEQQVIDRVEEFPPLSGQGYASDNAVESESPLNELTENQLNIKLDILNKLEVIQTTEVDIRKRLPKIQEHTAKKVIDEANKALQQIVQEEQPDLNRINQLIYACACVVTEKTTSVKPAKQRKNNNDQACKRVERQVQTLRRDLSILVEYKRENIRKSQYKVEALLKKYSIKNEDDLVLHIEQLKQKITVKVQRKKRIGKRIEQFRQNKIFHVNQKQMYRILRNQNSTIDTTKQPDINEVENFWANMFENNVEHNENAEWLQNLCINDNDRMVWNQIAVEEVKGVCRKLQNWKSPGLDQVTNFWLKKLTALHQALAEEFNKIVDKTTQPPEWFTQGITYLIPKIEKPEQPKDYRPITCLPTMYKLFTAVVAQKLGNYIRENNIMPVEQKGCCKNSAGCKDQLLISKSILKDCKERRRNLAIAWIDYRKAFDSVPHSWLLKSLELAGAAEEILEVCRTLISTWNTTCIMREGERTLKTRKLKIKRGIFQGDSLSPLLFCIALIPMSKLINKLKHGYKLKGSEVNLSHLVYLDDLKLFAANKLQLQEQIKIVETFSKDIKMSFGIDKCATFAIRSGTVTEVPDMVTEDGVIKQLDSGTYYKYLGIEESGTVNHEGMKKKLSTEYYTRVRSILRSQLNAKNKFNAIGTLAMPVLQYSFCIINWNMCEIMDLDRKTRKLLVKFDANHPQASVDRLYVPRYQGGRGLLQVERSYKSAVINTANYLHQRSNQDSIVNTIRLYDAGCSQFRSIQKRADEYLREVNLNKEQIFRENLQVAKEKVKKAYVAITENAWQSKEMYGQYIREMDNPVFDKEKSFMWLRLGGLKAETESLMVAAQDQALRTNYRENHIFKRNVSPICRVCKQGNETVTHILSSCPILAQRQYIERHDNVAKMLHYNICKAYNISVAKNWYDHVPKQVTTSNEHVTILWNSPINTDRTIRANKPDIVIRDTQTNRKCILIDVAVPADNNVNAKEADKILKYSDLRIEIQRMWNTTTEVIPIVVGATGAISRKFEDYLKAIPGKHRLNEIQKTAILGSAHILRKTLM